MKIGCPTCLGSGCAECFYSGSLDVDEKEFFAVQKVIVLAMLILLLATILAR